MEEKKPGATRNAFIIVGFAMVIFAVVLGFAVYRADLPLLEKLALLAMNGVIFALGTVTGYLYGAKT